MWQIIDKLWQTSPAFKVLAPIFIIGGLLLAANMFAPDKKPKQQSGKLGLGANAAGKVGEAVESAAQVVTTAADAVTGSIIENTEVE